MIEISSISLRAAAINSVYFGTFLSNIYINNVNKIGHKSLKRSVSVYYDSLRINILTQNKIRIKIAGWACSGSLITSIMLSINYLSLFLYLSMLPLYMRKQILSKFFILCQVSDAFEVNKSVNKPPIPQELLNKSEIKSLLSLVKSIIVVQYLRVSLLHRKKSFIIKYSIICFFISFTKYSQDFTKNVCIISLIPSTKI